MGPVVNGFYIFITVFGLPPLVSGQPFTDIRSNIATVIQAIMESWLLDFLKAGAGVGLAVVFFESGLCLLRWTPVGVGLAARHTCCLPSPDAVAPVLIMPLFYKFEPLRDMELAAREEFVQRAGSRWSGLPMGLDEKT
jgi:hypothetical protein